MGSLSQYDRRACPLAAALSLLISTAVSAQTSVTTNRNDLARTGANLSEPSLTTTNVNVAQFGKLFERTVDDEVYAQPLYVANVNVPGVGVRNVVYVATVRNTVYAFDADDPTASSPLWRRVLINPPQVVSVHRSDVGQACGTYLDLAGNIGIIGTPVIDPTSQTIYFVARTKESGTFVQRLHALDITTGNNRAGSPVVIQGSVRGWASGTADGVVPFNARTQNQRAGLMLLNGIVYIAWASHCDQGPYHGWILGYNASTLQQTFVYNTTPDGGWGGIWQSGQALSADPAGNIYTLNGNGDFDANSGGRNFGTSIQKISPAGAVLDWFTPYNWQFLNNTDGDLFWGAVHIPNTNLVLGGGKQGLVYVLDRDNMGHIRSGNDGQIVQSFQGSTSGRMNGSPVFWNTPTNGPVIYLWPAGDPLKAFRLVNGRFQTTPVAESTARAPSSMPGGIMSLSAFGSTPGSGILWATMSNSGDANSETQPGIVRAYDANDVRRELWNSEQNATRDRLGNFAKFNPPTIANGKLYVPTFSNKLVAYGLLGGTPGNQAPVVNAGSDQAITLPATASLSGTVIDDGNPNPPGVLTVTWSQVTGPGTVSFGAPNLLSTSASFSTAGTYTLRLTASDGAAGGSDELVVTVAPSVGSGTGLRAEYFNDAGNGAYFTTAAGTRVDATIDFSWGASPGTGVQADNFSVRWTGQVQAPLTGNYTFTTESNDGIRLWVNSQLVIDNWADHTAVLNTSAAVPLVMNTNYDIRLEFYDHTGPAVARLLWTPPGQALQVIPQTRLFPAPAPNQPPTVNAGPDQAITQPNTATLQGSASDDGLPAPSALTYAWTKISGREESENPVVFSNPSSLTTTVTFPAADIYVLRLTVTDGALTASDDVIVTVSAVNQAPTVSAGADRTVTLPNTLSLAGTASDDGLPNPPAALTTTWSRVSGPGGANAVTFGNVNALNTTASFSTAGTYVLRLTASDSVLSAFDELTVTVSAANQAPTVSAGADRTVTLPNTLSLAGTASDDGLPNPPATLTTTWSRVSGPGTVTFGNVNALSTTASFSAAGSYVLRLTASDSVLSTSDDLTVTVSASNQAPTVNAGADRAVTLPNTLSLAGTASDDGLPNPPATLTTTWSRVSGPGTVTFGNANALSTTAGFSAAGSYVLRLTASDSVLSATDDVSVTVDAATGAPGTGLTGQYYSDRTLTTLRLTRTDPIVNFNWGSGSPAANIPNNNFSVRWTGQVRPPVSGQYVFSTVADDGVRLWVNGQLVIDAPNDRGASTNTSAQITLTADTNYAIQLEYYERTGSAAITLNWAFPGQSTQIIPQIRLYP